MTRMSKKAEIFGVEVGDVDTKQLNARLYVSSHLSSLTGISLVISIRKRINIVN